MRWSLARMPSKARPNSVRSSAASPAYIATSTARLTSSMTAGRSRRPTAYSKPSRDKAGRVTNTPSAPPPSGVSWIQEEQHLPEGQRGHQEEEAAGPQRHARRRPALRTRPAAPPHGQRQQHGGCRAEYLDQVDGIGADAEEGAVGQADQPRAAHQQLQAEREHRRLISMVEVQLQIVRLGEQRQRRDAQRRRGQHHVSRCGRRRSCAREQPGRAATAAPPP